jgi:APA family basic amino acid/polyamine antiporter
LKELDRSLGLVAVVAISISAMLGSGIFVLPGLAAAKTGPSVWIAYLVAGLCVMPAALCKAELATAMPASGGSYVYLERIFGPMAGTIAGVALWASMLLKSTFALLGFGAYLRVFVHVPETPAGDATLKNYAMALLVGVVALNIFGIKKVGKAQVIVVTIALVGLVGLAAFAVPSFDASRLSPALTHGTTGLFAASAFVFISYDGVTKVAAIAEEVKQPARNLPAGILISLGLVLVVYVVVSLTLVGTAPLSELSVDLKPIHSLAEHVGGHSVGLVFAVLGVVTMTSMANAGLLAASRFPFAMSRDRLLPSFLSGIHVRFKTPIAAILVTGVVMAAAIQLLELERVAKLASAVVIMIFVAENIAVILFRESRVQWYQPKFKAPLYPLLQALGVLAGGTLLITLGYIGLIAAVSVAVPGAAIFLLYGRRRVERRGVVGKIGKRGDLLRPSDQRATDSTDPVDTDAAAVVALFGQERSPEMLVEVAGALAQGRKVRASHLTEVEHGTSIDTLLIEDAAAQSLKRRIAATAQERELDVEFRAVVSRDLVRTVHSIASRVHCDWLVMQWAGRSRQSLTSLSPIGWLINHLDSNLAMFKDAGVRYVRRILVLPAPGPHDALVMRAADDLASTWGAELTLARFVPDDASDIAETAEMDYLSQLQRLCKLDTDEVVWRGSDKLATITSHTSGFDLVVMAAPHVTLRNLLRSSIEDQIAERAACSVLTLKTPRSKTHEAFSTRPVTLSEKRTLADYLDSAAVGARLEMTGKNALFGHIAAAFAEELDNVDAKTIQDAIVEREREQNTAVGGGVALPHGSVAEAGRSVVGVFTTSKAVAYGAPDDEPVDVFFATCCPPAERETHLRLLSDIARLTIKTNVLERLRAAKSAEEIIAAIEACMGELEK